MPTIAKPREVKVKLVRLTPKPILKDIDNYNRALSIYEYDLLESDGVTKRIVVLKWSIWNRRVLKNLPKKVGDTEIMDIDLMSNYDDLKNDRIIGEVEDKSSLLYIDIGSFPKSGKHMKLALGKGISKKGVREDWLFLNDDIRHMNAGKYWERWKEGGEVDVLDVILDFKRKLNKQGVELLLVPVPAKGEIYRDYLAGVEPFKKRSGVMKVLTDKGIAVVNLNDVFLKYRLGIGNTNRIIYCKTDSHWSPEGCNIAAKFISGLVKNKVWYKGVNKKQYETDIMGLLEITGDLLDAGVNEKEVLPIERIRVNGKFVLKEQAKSPILLLGDSHTLVFGDDSKGDKKFLFADGSGLADWLAFYSGVAVDVIGSLGSGMNGARGKLYRKRSVNENFPDYWKSKKLVIWCFSEKEFSNPVGLSLKMPLLKN